MTSPTTQTSARGSHDRVSLERFLAALEAHDCNPRPRGDGLDALCPVHDVNSPSLSADWKPPTHDKAGRVVFECKAGCDRAAVIAAIGLSWADLYDGLSPEAQAKSGARGTSLPRRRPAPEEAPVAPQGRTPDKDVAKARKTTQARLKKAMAGHTHTFAETTHTYTDADGVILARVHRHKCTDTGCPDKKKGRRFATSYPEGKNPYPGRKLGDWLGLYNLPLVAAAIADGLTIHVTEGEGDADAVIAAGGVGTSHSNGAGSWSSQHTEQLRGAHVVVVADNDLVGYRHAAHVADELDGVAASVRVVRAAVDNDGADASDHLQAGHTLDDLEDVDPLTLEGALTEPAAPPAAPAPQPKPSEKKADEPKEKAGPKRRGPKPAEIEPANPLAMSTGQWRYSLGDGSDEFDRGVYRLTTIREPRSGERIEVWEFSSVLPYVLEQLVVRDGAARRARHDLRLTMSLDEGAEIAKCTPDQVKTGEWAQMLNVPLSADDKVQKAVQTAINEIAVTYAPEQEAVPRWVNEDTLVVPSGDVAPAGYFVEILSEGRARTNWQKLLTLAAEDGNERLALMMGGALGGVFLSPLERQGFWILAVGGARQGKSTGMFAGAAIFGNPKYVVTSWSVSPIGLMESLGALGIVTAFRDELGASGLTGPKLEQTIFTTTDGAKRTIGLRGGGSRTTAGWNGVLFATGNVSVTGRITNEGIAARVVEIPTPIVKDGKTAKRVMQLSHRAYGWPLRWLLADLRLDDFRAAVAKAEDELGSGVDGVASTLGEHLALAIAGAERLEEMLDITGLRDAALRAARERLGTLTLELEERGGNPADRLLAAVVQAVSSRPGAFPDIELYKAYIQGGENAPQLAARELEGFYLAPQHVAVFSNGIKAIASAADIEDALLGLRDLRDDGRLIANNQLRNKVRTGRTTVDTYTFVLPFGNEEEESNQGSDGGGDDNPNQGPNGGDGGNCPGDAGTPPSREPVQQQLAEPPAERQQQEGTHAVAPAVDEEETQTAAQMDDVPGGTCVRCGHHTTHQSNGAWAHMEIPGFTRCDIGYLDPSMQHLNAQVFPHLAQQPAAPAAPAAPSIPAQSTAPAETPSPRQAVTPAVPAEVTPQPAPGADATFPNGPLAVLDVTSDGQVLAHLVDGRTLDCPARSIPTLVKWALEAGLGAKRLHKWGTDGDPMVILTAAATKKFGLPEILEDVRHQRLPDSHKVVKAIAKSGFELTKRGFSPWTRIYKPIDKENGGNRACVQIGIVSWDALGAKSGWYLDEGTSAADIARTLGIYTQRVIAPRGTMGSSGLELMLQLRPATRPAWSEEEQKYVPGRIEEHLHRTVKAVPCEAHASHPVVFETWPNGERPAEEFMREEAWSWHRDATAEEAASFQHVIGIDTNTSFLSSSSRLLVGGNADPVHHVAPAFDPKTPGAWKVDFSRAHLDLHVPDGKANPLDPRLPSPFTNTGEPPTGPRWYTTQTCDYARKMGIKVEPIEAWLRTPLPSGWLDPWNERLATAYKTTMANLGLGITEDMPMDAFLAAMERLAAGEGDPIERTVLKAIKQSVKSGIGKLAQTPSYIPGYRPGTEWTEMTKFWWRPDIRAAVISTARIVQHRKIVKTFELTGRAPLATYSDCVVYPAHTTNPLEVIRPDAEPTVVKGAFNFGVRPGYVKLEGIRSFDWYQQIQADGINAAKKIAPRDTDRTDEGE
ncbi:telomere-associated protein Tap [Streptomyces sp. NPDC051546]|uniref:telomere-associated protein Tap n=1 Tax=Streptomyces sp. NPDC051546 TaxID=3365655 RepID=UPI0037A4E714